MVVRRSRAGLTFFGAPWPIAGAECGSPRSIQYEISSATDLPATIKFWELEWADKLGKDFCCFRAEVSLRRFQLSNQKTHLVLRKPNSVSNFAVASIIALISTSSSFNWV